jgi:5-methylcytosine-specific restriction endonuclease McrA
VDHILARAFGGTDDESNLQSLCKVHADHKNHLDREAGKKLKRGR